MSFLFHSSISKMDFSFFNYIASKLVLGFLSQAAPLSPIDYFNWERETIPFSVTVETRVCVYGDTS